MKIKLLNVFLVLSAVVSLGAEPPGIKPVSVVAIDPKTGSPVPPEKPGVSFSGNIKMTFSDGHAEIVATNATFPRVSEKGDAGWVDANENLIIRRVDGKIRGWKTEPGDLVNTAIENWGFADHGSAIVVHWTGKHLLRNFFKYDFASGKITARVHHPMTYDQLPAWAKSIASRDDFF